MDKCALGLIAAYLLSKAPTYVLAGLGEVDRAPFHRRRSVISAAACLVLAAFVLRLGLEWASVPVSAVVILLLALSVLRLVFAEIAPWLASGQWWRFALVEAAEFGLALLLISQYCDVGALARWADAVSRCPRTYGILVAYAVSVGFGAGLVPLVTASLAPGGEEPADSIRGAGKYIGVLERLLITSLIIYLPRLDAAGIGLLFGAKSIARFPEFKKTRFAEYYLVGTLTSFAVAILVGLVARFWLPPY